jgi:transcriptional regulator with XRE-family HTH domain
MPATSPPLIQAHADQLAGWGALLRTHRKALRISATAAAEAAGMSRVTWHRIERGEASVTVGAWLAAMSAVGLKWDLEGPPLTSTREQLTSIPVRVRLSDYPELKRLAWQVHGTDELSPVEALDIYERNHRHLDEPSMAPNERDLLVALRAALRGTPRHV